jgi:hypothetical protein
MSCQPTHMSIAIQPPREPQESTPQRTLRNTRNPKESPRYPQERPNRLARYIKMALQTAWEVLGRSGTLWDVLRRSGTLWDALGRSETLWDALGRSGALWDALGRFGTLWDASSSLHPGVRCADLAPFAISCARCSQNPLPCTIWSCDTQQLRSHDFH